MRDPFGPIELTADGVENLYRITHDCQSCLCGTCEVHGMPRGICRVSYEVLQEVR